MTFAEPLPFESAVALLQERRLLPTAAGSRLIREDLAPAIAKRSWFSARVTDVRFLDAIAQRVGTLTSPATTAAQGERRLGRAKTRELLRDTLRATGWDAEAEGVVPGSLQDLASDGRLNLIIDTNRDLIRGFGRWADGQNEDVLDIWPAQELVRISDPIGEPRDWPARWVEAGGELIDGRMVALKNDPIWVAISAFGLPYEPFDYNSGMGLVDIEYREALDLGLLRPGDRVAPEPVDLTADVYAKAPDSPEIRRALLKAFGDDLSIEGGEMTLAPRPRPSRA